MLIAAKSTKMNRTNSVKKVPLHKNQKADVQNS